MDAWRQQYSEILLGVTTSTQDDARAAFEGRPVLVIASGQTRGRGRRGSDWTTAPRALATSLAVAVEPAAVLPLVAGVAVARILGVDLKWPNDVMRGDVKVGGILVEAGGGVAVIGLGLNLWWPDPPPGVGGLHSEDPGPGLGPEVARAWAAELLALAGSDPWPRDEYRRRCRTLGREITWQPEGQGRAVDIAEGGGLVVETGEGMVTLTASEITEVR